MKQKKTIELAEVSTKCRNVCCTLLVCTLYQHSQQMFFYIQIPWRLAETIATSCVTKEEHKAFW